jgi:REP element-mobilizing transposase RayT
VWGTKNRLPFLTDELKHIILGHIRANAKDKGIYIDSLNGHSEHLHCLLSLNPDQPLSAVIQMIKGESSFWINRNKLTKFKFEWAEEYFAVSISDSHVSNIRDYIKNQEEHHRKRSWDEEYNEFLIKYQFYKIKGLKPIAIKLSCIKILIMS